LRPSEFFLRDTEFIVDGKIEADDERFPGQAINNCFIAFLKEIGRATKIEAGWTKATSRLPWILLITALRNRIVVERFYRFPG